MLIKFLKKYWIVIALIILFWIFIDSYHKGQGARERERKEYKQHKTYYIETLSSVEYAKKEEDRLRKVEFAALNRFKNYENPKLTRLGISPEIQHSVEGWAQNTGIDPALIYAIIEYESSFNPNQFSKGDYGLMQVNQINVDYYSDFYQGAINPYDINDNVYMGCQILKNNYNANDLHYSLMCYNMGQKRANELRKEGIRSSEYSKKIIASMNSYKKYIGGNNGY